MRAIPGHRSREAWWVASAVVAAVLLILATGCCVFDRDDDATAGHVAPPDLCLGMLAVSLAVMSLARLPVVGWAIGPAVAAPYVVPRHLPDPPPKSALFR